MALFSSWSPSCVTVILFVVHLVLTFFFFLKNTRRVVSVRTHSVDSSTDRPRNTTEQHLYQHSHDTWQAPCPTEVSQRLPMLLTRRWSPHCRYVLPHMQCWTEACFSYPPMPMQVAAVPLKITAFNFRFLFLWCYLFIWRV